MRKHQLALGLSTLFLLSSPTFAEYLNYQTWHQWPNVQPCLMGGFYLGAGVGYDVYRIRQDISSETFADEGFPLGLTSGNPDLSVRGVEGKLFAGYGMYFDDRYYFALEAFINWSNANTTTTVSAFPAFFGLGSLFGYQSYLSVKESFNISVLPGIKVDASTLFYARVGYTRTKFRDQEKFSFFTLNALNATASTWANGITFGLGMEKAAYGNFTIRAEYAYTTYDTFKNIFTTVDLFPPITSTSKLSPANNQFEVDVIYHFC